MGAAQTEAFNHITAGTRPSATSGSGSSFILKEADGQEDSRGDNKWRSPPDSQVVILADVAIISTKTNESSQCTPS